MNLQAVRPSFIRSTGHVQWPLDQGPLSHDARRASHRLRHGIKERLGGRVFRETILVC